MSAFILECTLFFSHSLTVKGGSAQLRSKASDFCAKSTQAGLPVAAEATAELPSECQVSFIPHLLMESHDGNEATPANLKRNRHEDQLEEGRRKVGKRVSGSLSHEDG